MLGKIGKDKITGFTGMITSVHTYLTGCSQYGLQPQDLTKDGEPQKIHYFDTGRVDIVADGITVESVSNNNPGGPERERP